MARLTDGAGHILLWNLEKCEETAVAGAIVIVSAKVNNDRIQDLSAKFFAQGLAVSDPHLKSLNRTLVKCGIHALDIRETDASDYARMWSDYADKIRHREEQRHRFATASALERMEMLQEAIDEMALLLPPHMTLAEHREAFPRMESRTTKATLEAERIRRLAALEAQMRENNGERERKAPPSLNAEQAILLLKNTSNAALIEKIVNRLNPESQLQLVESEHVSQELKDTIIERILSG